MSYRLYLVTREEEFLAEFAIVDERLVCDSELPEVVSTLEYLRELKDRPHWAPCSWIAFLGYHADTGANMYARVQLRVRRA